MPAVTRLATFAELYEDSDADRLAVSARLEAVLDDGRRVLLLDDRGWAWSPGGGDVEAVAETARVVVGPDEAFGDHSQADMERDHWNTLAGTLRAHGGGRRRRRIEAPPA
jgi:hypothetical protein